MEELPHKSLCFPGTTIAHLQGQNHGTAGRVIDSCHRGVTLGEALELSNAVCSSRKR